MSNRLTAVIAAPIKLTFDSQKGLFKKCVGKKRGEDGQLRPRIFWLGRIQHVALQRAKIYSDLWREIEEMGLGEWTPEYEQEAERQVRNAEHWQQAVSEATARRVEQTLALGDSSALVTEAVYAERDAAKVEQVMLKIG